MSLIGFAAQAAEADSVDCQPAEAYNTLMQERVRADVRVERAIAGIDAMEAVAGEDATLLAAYGAAVEALGEVLLDHSGSYPVAFAEVEEVLLPVVAATDFTTLEQRVWQWVTRVCGEPLMGCAGFLAAFIKSGSSAGSGLVDPRGAPDPVVNGSDSIFDCRAAAPAVLDESIEGDDLPHTGSAAWALALVSATLLAAGGGALRRGRRSPAPG